MALTVGKVKSVLVCFSNMKRDSNEMTGDEQDSIFVEERIDHTDMGEKVTCIVNFVAKTSSLAKYKDSFLVFTSGKFRQPRKDIVLVWYCRHFNPYLPIAHGEKDPRDHEALLSEHFTKHNLEIEKLPMRWQIKISTPERGLPGSKKVVVEPLSNVL
jgi:hypothetical protein